MAAKFALPNALVCCLCSFSAPTEVELESHIDVFHANIFRSGQELDFGETNLDPKSNDFFFSNEFIYQDLDSYKVGGSNSQMTNPVPSKGTNEVSPSTYKGAMNKASKPGSTSEVKKPVKRGRPSKASILAEQALANVSTESSNLDSSTEVRLPSSSVANQSSVAKQSKPEPMNRKRLSNENSILPQAEGYKRVKEEFPGAPQLFQDSWVVKEVPSYDMVSAQQQQLQDLQLKQAATVEALQESQARTAVLELRLNALTESKDMFEIENFGLKKEMSDQQQKSELKVKELNSAKEQLSKMSQIFNSKNAQLSLLKLNEERLILDNNKYQKEFKKMQENAMIQGEKFETIRSTLGQVLEKDNDFCNNPGDILKSISDDSEVCNIVTCMILDYVEGKKLHQIDVQSANDQFKSYKEKIFSYKKTILELVRKIKTQTEAYKNKDRQLKDLQEKKLDKEVVTMKHNISVLVEKIKIKDDKIKELAAAATKSKTREGQYQKLTEAIQQLKLKEVKYMKDISGLKKELLVTKDTSKVKIEPGSGQESIAIEQLRAEMTKQEAEYYESLEKYINNLDKMKKQVETSFEDKNSTIALLTNQLKSHQTLLASARKALAEKSSEVDKLRKEFNAPEVSPDSLDSQSAPMELDTNKPSNEDLAGITDEAMDVVGDAAESKDLSNHLEAENYNNLKVDTISEQLNEQALELMPSESGFAPQPEQAAVLEQTTEAPLNISDTGIDQSNAKVEESASLPKEQTQSGASTDFIEPENITELIPAVTEPTVAPKSEITSIQNTEACTEEVTEPITKLVEPENNTGLTESPRAPSNNTELTESPRAPEKNPELTESPRTPENNTEKLECSSAPERLLESEAIPTHEIKFTLANEDLIQPAVMEQTPAADILATEESMDNSQAIIDLKQVSKTAADNSVATKELDITLVSCTTPIEHELKVKLVEMDTADVANDKVADTL